VSHWHIFQSQEPESYTALPVISRELSGFSIASGETGPLPQDPDGDGKYEDTNGNHRADFADVVLFFQNLDRVISTQPWWLFDYDTNSAINLNDVVTLFTIVSA
jgi:PKD repeat protein